MKAKIIKKFIFPNHCVICDTVLPFGFKLENEYICNDCKDNLEFIKEPYCKKCGAMINDEDEIYCPRCKLRLYKSFEYGFGLCRYNDAVKESLHRIKYDGRKEYIEFYGKCIARVYFDRFKEINPDFLVPVPIHIDRLRERNYNQATELAYSISDELKKRNLNIEVNENLILRKKNTKVLNKLDESERSKELFNAFKTIDCTNINKVIIVDDIYTTGGTINTIAEVLIASGVKEIYFVTIAIVDNM